MVSRRPKTNEMKTKRRDHSAAFKAKVALEALRGELTVTELVAKHGVHQTRINTWKRHAMEDMAEAFDSKTEAAAADHEAEIAKLHAKINELLVELDFFTQSLRTMSVSRRREMIDPSHFALSVTRQCKLVSISRSALYAGPNCESPLNL